MFIVCPQGSVGFLRQAGRQISKLLEICRPASTRLHIVWYKTVCPHKMAGTLVPGTKKACIIPGASPLHQRLRSREESRSRESQPVRAAQPVGVDLRQR